MVKESGAPARAKGVVKSGGSSLSKSIGWLNKSGVLQQPIIYSDVIESLSGMGDSAAEQLLGELEQKGWSVKDPTKWLKAAAARGGAGKGGTKSSKGGGSSSLSKSIGWLNNSGMLAAPITYSDVIAPLSALGEAKAQELLAELEQKGFSVADPTNWLCAAAKRAGSRGKGASKGFSGYAAPMAIGGLLGALKGAGKGGSWIETSPWVSKAIGKLNNSDKLKDPIDWNATIGLLSSIPESVAIGLIKELEGKAAEVKNPTSWLAAAAQKSVGRGKKFSSTISKKIGELNKTDKLKEPVSWNECSGPLLLMEEAEAEALIAELEEKAAEIKNPTGWLKSAAEKSFKKRKTDKD